MADLTSQTKCVLFGVIIYVLITLLNLIFQMVTFNLSDSNLLDTLVDSNLLDTLVDATSNESVSKSPTTKVGIYVLCL